MELEESPITGLYTYTSPPPPGLYFKQIVLEMNLYSSLAVCKMECSSPRDLMLDFKSI